MAFLVLLVTLGGYKLLGLHFKPRHDRWFVRLSQHFIRTFKYSPRLAMFCSFALPLLAVGTLFWVTRNWLFGLAGLLLQVAVLAYALGRVNLLQELKIYLQHWRAGDSESAYLHGGEHFRVEQGFEADDRATLHKSMCRGLVYQWFEQVFVIIFWYLVAGPLAALFIRLLCLYDQQTASTERLQLLHALEWLPARLLEFTFAVAGNFTQCFRAWLGALGHWRTPTETILYRSALAGIGICDDRAMLARAELNACAEQLQALQDLVVRSLIVWLVVVALVSLL